jgi:hypothetical protein
MSSADHPRNFRLPITPPDLPRSDAIRAYLVGIETPVIVDGGGETGIEEERKRHLDCLSSLGWIMMLLLGVLVGDEVRDAVPDEVKDRCECQ